MMSDSVLAAFIAAAATICASFLQLRTALAKDADARSRGQAISRQRGRWPLILVGIMLLAAAVGGFALAQWLGNDQRSAQADLQRELRARIDQLTQALVRLEQVTATVNRQVLAATAVPASAPSAQVMGASPAETVAPNAAGAESAAASARDEDGSAPQVAPPSNPQPVLASGS